MINIKIKTNLDWVHRNEDPQKNTINESVTKEIYLFNKILLYSKTYSVDHTGNHEVVSEEDDIKMGFKR